MPERIEQPKLFRKKPVEVLALQWTGDNIDSIESFVGSHDMSVISNPGYNPVLKVWNEREKQWINCPINHFVIKGVVDEFYPCDPEVMEATYEPVE